MIFYLNNDCKFHLYFNAQQVIFVMYDSSLEGPMKTSTRWLHKETFDLDHMRNIIDLLKSNSRGDKNVGVKVLEQTLNVSINGEVEGHVEDV